MNANFHRNLPEPFSFWLLIVLCGVSRPWRLLLRYSDQQSAISKTREKHPSKTPLPQEQTLNPVIEGQRVKSSGVGNRSSLLQKTNRSYNITRPVDFLQASCDNRSILLHLLRFCKKEKSAVLT